MRVMWSEGMFMSPQHLQRQDAYHEGRLDLRLQCLTPHCWGITELDLDDAALDGGQVRIHTFQGVLPQGTILSFDRESGDQPQGRAIEGHFSPTSERQEVYLAVPREREGVANYGAAADENLPRWVGNSRKVIDAASAASDVEVDFGQPNLRILFGDEPRGDFDCIKVAEIERNASGGLYYSRDYVPPVLRIGASSYLMDQMGQLLSAMVSRQRVAAEATRSRDSSSVEFMGSDVTRFLLLNALNGSVPVIKYMRDAGENSPQQLYFQLLSLAGQLSTFSAEAETASLPVFNHGDLYSTFSMLFGRIRELLGASVMENYLPVPLVRQLDGTYQGQLQDDRLTNCREFYLAVEADLPEGQIAEQLPKLSKIASKNDIDGFVQAALPGVQLTLTYRPPAQIPIRPGVVYFSLDASSPNWRNVVFERAVVVYLPPPFSGDGVKLQLLAIPS